MKALLRAPAAGDADLPLLGRAQCKQLDALLGNLPALDEKTYEVWEVTDVALKETDFDLKKLWGLEPAYAMPEELLLVRVSNDAIKDFTAKAGIDAKGFNVSLTWKYPLEESSETEVVKFVATAKRLLGEG